MKPAKPRYTTNNNGHRNRGTVPEALPEDHVLSMKLEYTELQQVNAEFLRLLKAERQQATSGGHNGQTKAQ